MCPTSLLVLKIFTVFLFNADVQLAVKGCADLIASFREYCKTETLDGDNKYNTDTWGLVDARKGILFDALPQVFLFLKKVFHMQLLRFEYDMTRDAMVKINDKHTFPLLLDLKEFTTDPSLPCEYTLHAVLVHAGDMNAGHYTAFIRPTLESWLKFDDDRVTAVTQQEAVDANFGTGKESAYLLVYIRLFYVKPGNDFIPQVVGGVELVPADLQALLEAQEKARVDALRDAQHAHLYTLLTVSKNSPRSSRTLTWRSTLRSTSLAGCPASVIHIQILARNSKLKSKCQFPPFTIWSLKLYLYQMFRCGTLSSAQTRLGVPKTCSFRSSPV